MNIIYTTIRRMGVSPKYKGYYLLADAVQRMLEHISVNDDSVRITKDIYPYLERKHNMKFGTVDNNLRTVSRISWEKNPEFMIEIYGCTRKDKLTNGELVHALAAYIAALLEQDEK